MTVSAHTKVAPKNAKIFTKTRQWVSQQFTKVDTDLERYEEAGLITSKMMWEFPVPRRISRQYTEATVSEIGTIARDLAPSREYDPRITDFTVSGSGKSAVLVIAFNDYP